MILYQIFFSPQLKRNLIINNKHDIYNCLKNIRKISKHHRIGHCVPSPPQNKNFVNTSKKLVKNRSWTFLVVRCFIRKLKFVSNTLWRIVASSKEPYEHISESKRYSRHQEAIDYCWLHLEYWWPQRLTGSLTISSPQPCLSESI